MTMKKLGWFRPTAGVAFAIVLAACGGGDGRDGAPGDDGANGTPGTQGPQGTTGLAGANGTTGPAGTAGTAGATGPTKSPRLTDTRITGWSAANRARLDKLLVDRGIASAGFDPAKRPVAVFDWDNTILKNDIGDATFFWMVKHDKIRQPAGKDWSTTNAALSTAAKTALASCDALAVAGDPLPTSSNTACADAIVHTYLDGAAGWNPEITSKTNNGYAWVAQLTAGYTPDEIRGFARAAYWENVSAPINATQTVGTVGSLNAYVRIYEPIADLIGALQDNGFDVWITTASPQYFVDAISPEVGVAPSKVVGIRDVLVNGKVTSSIEGCGTIADGTNTMITFDTGKRCWINRVIFREASGSQMATNPDVTKRPVFVAGDSDTDIAMLKDATDLKLVINRNKMQTMCNALGNYQNKWIWEPMFINPKAKKATPYDCDTAKDNDGVNVIVNEAGQPFPKLSEP
jgi:phosphoserine phosphatase